MRLDELQSAMTQQPFEPFRINLSNGQSYEIRHTEFASLNRFSIYVGVENGEDNIPDRTVKCDLLHVVSIEPVNGARNDPDSNLH